MVLQRTQILFCQQLLWLSGYVCPFGIPHAAKNLVRRGGLAVVSSYVSGREFWESGTLTLKVFTLVTALLLDEIETEAVVQHWAAEAEGSASNQRSQTRFPFLNAATVTWTDTDFQVMSRDLSQKGIGIVQCGNPAKLGPATLCVSLRQQEVYLDVNFSWMEDLGHGWWCSGGRLNLASIDPASLLVLKMSKVVDRRLHERHPFCHPFAVYAQWQLERDCIGVENIQPEDETRVISLDISRGGIRLISQDPIMTDKEFVYLRKLNDEYSDKILRGRIVSRQEFGNGYFAVGVKFDFV